MGHETLLGVLIGGGEPGARLGARVEGFMATQVIATVARLGVPDRLAEGPRSAAELAAGTGADAGALARLLRSAVAYGVLTQDEHGCFGLTAEGELLRSDVDGSARDFILGFTGPPFWNALGRLEDVVLSGQAAAAPGPRLWAELARRPEDARRFARGMGASTARLVAELPRAYDPSGFERIVDVGGGQGTLLSGLLAGAPRATGVLFDLPEQLAEAPAVLAAAGVADRTETVAGSFLEAVPAGGDLYVLSGVLHNWGDDTGCAILANVHEAARPGSTLLVIEVLLPPGPGPSRVHLVDLMMLAATNGRQRTREEHEAQLTAAGYELVRDVALDHLVEPWHILEARRV